MRFLSASRLGFVGVLAGTLAMCGCSKEDHSAPAQVENATAMIVEFEGCATLHADARCGLAADATLDLWIGGDIGSVDVQLGARRIDATNEASPRGGGWLLHLRPAALPSTLRIVHTDSATPLLLLSIDPVADTALDRELQSLLDSGDIGTAIARMRSALGTLPNQERAPILSRLARAETRAGQWPQAEADFIAAIAAHETDGRESAAVSDRTALAYHYLSRQSDFVRASALLDDAKTSIAGDARSRLLLASTRGYAARLSGDLVRAERSYRDALHRADRLGDSVREAVARNGLAQVQAEMGDFAQSAATMAAISAETLAQLSDCDRARLFNSRAWIHLLARESGQDSDDPRPDLDRARDLLAVHCTQSNYDRSNVDINRALANVQSGDGDAAAVALAEARALAADLPAEQRAWFDEIEARIALARGDTQTALSRFRALHQRAGALLMVDTQWRALLGAADCAQRLGDIDAAIDDLAAADRLLGDYVRALPALESRALYLARYPSLPQRWIDLLLQRGRVHEALQVARRYRNEPLLQVQRLARIAAMDADGQRQWRELVARYRQLRTRLDAAAASDWTLSAQQLQAARGTREQDQAELRTIVDAAANLGQVDLPLPPAANRAGELSLLYFPLTRGWVAFTSDAQGLHAERLTEVDTLATPARLAQDLLEPFREALERSQRLRLMAYGPLLDLDFHRLPWNDRTLGAAMQVSYAADLPTPTNIDERPEQMLLVADPAGDLPAARSEIAGIADLLSQRRPQLRVERLQGEAASVDAITRGLRAATLFHYAGHTSRDAGAEADVGFALADGQRLELGDILMLDRAPRIAVLAACDSADAAGATPAQALSLAHAFLARGSEDVIATTRPVADAESAQLTARLHALYADGRPIDEALSEAQRQLLAAAPDGDWAAFRLYTR